MTIPTLISTTISKSTLKIGDNATVTFTFSEEVTGFTVADLTSPNATLSNLTSNDAGLTWTATLTPQSNVQDDTNVITLDNTGVRSVSSLDQGTGTTDSSNYSIDTQRPTATIVIDDTTLTQGETSLVTITFSEAVTNFSNANMSVSSGSLGALSTNDNGKTWTGLLTPPPQTVSNGNQMGFNASGVLDQHGNSGSGLVLSNIYNISTAGPTATIVVADTALSIGETSLVTFTFNKPVTSFANDDLTVVNGTLTAVSSSDGGITWTSTFTPTANITDATNVITLNNAGVMDVNGNVGLGNSTSNNYAIDTQRPIATVVVANSVLKIGDTSQVTITFNEAVTDFTNADLSISNGTLSAVSSSDGGITWTATFTPSAFTSDATNLITLDNTGVSDFAGNAGSGPTDSNNYAIDTQRPTATIVMADSVLTAGETSLVTITFSEAVTGFTNADLLIPSGTLSAVSSMDGITWTATFTPTDSQINFSNVISLNNTGVVDLAGNAGTGITNSGNFSVSTLRPTATIVVADSALAIGETSLVTINFSEAVTGFNNADLTIVNGTLTAVSSSDGGVTWTTTFTPTSNITDPTNVITLDNAGVTNVFGNIGAGTSTSNNYAIDTQRPTATIVVADNALAAGETSLVTFTFSEAVSGFDNTDLTTPNGMLSGLSSSDDGITWTATFTPHANINNITNVITLDNTGVMDHAGNTGSGTTVSNNYALDAVAPVFASASVNGRTLVLTYTESSTLDAVNRPAPEAFNVLVGAAPNAVTAVSVDPVAKTVTLTLTNAVAAGNAVTVAYEDLSADNDANAIQDLAGNDAATLAATAVTNNTPAPPVIPTEPTTPTVPPVVSVPVDGVNVTTTEGEGGTTIITVPVVRPIRVDDPNTPDSGLADIPIVKTAGGRSIIEVGVPVGVAVKAHGIATGLRSDAALNELLTRIESAGGNTEQLNLGRAFDSTVNPTTALHIQTLTLSTGAGFDASMPVVVRGSAQPGDGLQAVILDARALPSGSVIQVDNVDFVTVIGAVRIIGGAGQNTAAGDGAAQYIVLGADDDIIHGGGGNDTVGSRGGNDQLYGDAGDDIVFGGAGQDILSGGSGSDRLNGGTGFDVALQQGKRSDYSITLDGAGIKLTHIASGVSDWLVDVEQVRFETGPILTVAHSAAEEAAAFLFQKWMGRDLTQSEGAVIQTLDGLSAVQVADLFAQVFPQQAGGRTAQQLLEGMETAGAIRVDADRSTKYVGDAGDNTFVPTLGVAWNVDGGAGIDTLVFPATLAQTYIDASAKGFTLQRMADGAMLELINVERLTFSDTKLALDLDGHAGQAAKLLGALGGVGLLNNKPLVGEVIRALDAGVNAQSLAQLGLQVLGAKTSLEVTQLIWTNVVGSPATPTQLQPFVDLMAQGVTGGELAVLASNLDLNATRIDLVGLAATGIEFA